MSSPKNERPAGGLRPLRVVAIGGGTGLSTLLKGLKRYVVAPGQAPATGAPAIGSLTAVVTVTDDGGSSGRLRKEFNILPPGDIRNCIVALSEDEALLSKLFQYRFTQGAGLEGHSFGNLFVTALTAVTGDFAKAVELSSAILATRGLIVPSTTANVQLVAQMNDGSEVSGETNITASKQRIVELRMVPKDAQPLPETLAAIASADLITIGPGSLFTSLIPNLLVHGVVDAIAKSHALKVFVCNLMTQANESLGLTAADHVLAMYMHAAAKRLFDVALVNDRPVSAALRAKYAEEGQTPIAVDPEGFRALDLRVLTGDFLLEEDGVARHATERVAQALLALAARDHQQARAI
ncbi:MAG: uridine diphosphate-N-acetylglucosamine-binding protein YvcK [Candidatus Koribacter versatilis]|uniref:Putative gluconeogenesis factor n=1 Tax=Candidatus Korobacter versatilis TaxID=658062 RepID=A0A932A6P0_9BACT|nr:uridine diphosphate-N-acetylglucosamine-binding protein YvcK [Candidatus Koribacter versatilis]